MDWAAVQIVAMMKPADEFNNPRLEEALQFLKGPDFIPTDSRPAQVDFNGAFHFRFPRLAHANSSKTTWFMAGFTAARNDGRSGR